MAANPERIFPVICRPGIQRDGTTFASQSCIDGQWCRWYGGLPQKMSGYNKMISWDTNVPRGIFVVPDAPLFNIYVGDSNFLKYFPADSETGLPVDPLAPLVDRTPLSMVASQYNIWSFDTMFSTVDSGGILVAMANQNLYAIDQPVKSSIFYGDILSTERLVETGLTTSGGFFVLHPFLMVFDDDGGVAWTEANDPTTVMGTARVTGSKIVAGMPTRGGNSSPAGLLWSLDSVIRVTQVGTESIEFKFDTVTSESSILSSRSVVEYDGFYYWAGIDRFLCYNGVVQELPNSMNLQYFFDSLNYAQRQKVWATKYTKYGEIWWHYPSGNNTECNRAIIYNTREKIWYDTDSARCCGYFNQTFKKPIWADSASIANQYIIWRHGVGVNKVIDNVHEAINSYFEMSVISWVADGPGGQNASTNKVLEAVTFEPDFVQKGDIVLLVRGRKYANSIVDESIPYIFNNDPLEPHFKEKIDIHQQRRLMTFRFDSNEVNGYYQMGKCLLVPRFGDSRP